MYEQNNYINTSNDEGISINFKDIIGRTRKCISNYWISLIMFILISTGISLSIWSVLYKPTYENKIIYTVNITGEADQDYLATTFLSTSFSELMDSKLYNEIDGELRIENNNKYTVESEVLDNINMLSISIKSRDAELTQKVSNVIRERYPDESSASIGTLLLKPVSNSNTISIGVNNSTPLLFGAIGAAVGLLLCIFYIIFYSFRYKEVQSEETMSQITNLPKYGNIPEIQGTTSTKGKQVMRKVISEDLFNQGIKVLALKLQSQSKEVVMFVGSTVGEGVSKIVEETANNLIKTTPKILVLKMINGKATEQNKDIIKQIISSTPSSSDNSSNKLNFNSGSVSYLEISYTEFDEYSRDNKLDDQATGMEQFIDILKDYFDLILVDALPIDKYTYLPTFAKVVDKTIYVVKEDSSPIKSVRNGLEQLESNRFALTGYVLNYSNGVSTYYGDYKKSGKYGKYYV